MSAHRLKTKALCRRWHRCSELGEETISGPTSDIVVTNGRLVIGPQVIQGGVAIKDGVIAAIGRESSLPDSKEVIDVAGAYILPGVIDPHVHFREPGLTNREDFASGSTAATIGGVTTVFEMPNTVPPTAGADAVMAKRELVKPKSLVDFGLFGMVGQTNVDRIEEMAEAGVIGFKFYLHQTIEGMPPCDDGALFEAFQRIAAVGGVAAVHAENPEIIGRCSAHLRAHGHSDVTANIAARPTVSESEMVARCIAYARAAGNRLHICHVTSAESVDEIASAKRRHLPVTAETGPQWLWFTEVDAAEKGMVLMFSPPFRSEGDRKALWDALQDGRLDMVATDHAPRHREEKLVASVWDAKSGFIGVETNVPLMMGAVDQGRLSIQTYARISSENAARAFGLWPRKGSLLPGSDGDLTIVGVGAAHAIEAERLHSKAKVTPFDGVSTTGSVKYTILGGQVMMRDQNVTGSPRGRDVVRA